MTLQTVILDGGGDDSAPRWHGGWPLASALCPPPPTSVIGPAPAEAVGAAAAAIP